MVPAQDNPVAPAEERVGFFYEVAGWPTTEVFTRGYGLSPQSARVGVPTRLP
jgi:hypothetical protein